MLTSKEPKIPNNLISVAKKTPGMTAGIVCADHESSMESAKKAIELDPAYGDAYLNLGIAMLAEEKTIVDEMNNNLSNFKKYDALQAKQKALYEKVLPYLIKADNIKRSLGTVRMLLNIYDTLEKEAEADALRPIFKKMRNQ